MFADGRHRFEGWTHDAITDHAAALRATREHIERDQLAVVAAWWAAGGPDSACVGLVRGAAALLGISDRDARALVRVLRWCDRFAVTADAVHTGAVPVAVAAVFARVVTPARRDIYTRHEAAVLADLATLRIDETERYAAAWANAADDELSDPTSIEDEYEKRGLWASTIGGEGHLRGLLTPDTLAEILSVLDTMIPPDPLNIPGGPRTLAQRRHDALADLARLAGDGAQPGTGSGVTINAVIDIDRLLHHDGYQEADGDGCDRADEEDEQVWVTGPAPTPPPPPHRSRSEIDHAGPIRAHILRRYACDTWLTRTILDARSAILDHSHRTRHFTPAQRRALRIRDPKCAWPLCPHPSQWCDTHHLTPHHHGGETNLDNAVMLCRHHHTKTHAGWTLHRHPDHTYDTTPTPATPTNPLTPPVPPREGGDPRGAGRPGRRSDLADPRGVSPATSPTRAPHRGRLRPLIEEGEIAPVRSTPRPRHRADRSTMRAGGAGARWNSDVGCGASRNGSPRRARSDVRRCGGGAPARRVRGDRTTGPGPRGPSGASRGRRS